MSSSELNFKSFDNLSIDDLSISSNQKKTPPSIRKKKKSSKDKDPKPITLKEIKEVQSEIVKNVNLIFLNELKKLENSGLLTEENVNAKKEEIKEEYFILLPSDYNQRKYLSYISKLKKNNNKAQEILKQKEPATTDTIVVPENLNDLSLEDAMKSQFTLDGFNRVIEINSKEDSDWERVSENSSLSQTWEELRYTKK